jgi:hypothetical protein
MESSAQKEQSRYSAYFAALKERLANVPELRSSLDLITKNPELAARILDSYISLIADMSALDDSQRVFIHDAKEKVLRAGGNFGTASEVSADDLLAELGDNKNILANLAKSSYDPNLPYFKPALDELARRMEGGSHLKLSGRQPSDDDPDSRKVIWGHTMITDPEALVHFIFCHHLERYFAIALTDRGIELARQKDFMLNALIDVVLIMKRDGNHKYDRIYDLWRAPKDQGGLGWITDDRAKSYEQD